MTPKAPPTYDPPELFLLEPDGSRSPALPAALTPRGTQTAAWCRSCDKLHYHSADAGHRVAHCFVGDSPYRETGSSLVPVPGPPAALVPPRAQRRRPRRPTARDLHYRHGWRP